MLTCFRDRSSDVFQRLSDVFSRWIPTVRSIPDNIHDGGSKPKVVFPCGLPCIHHVFFFVGFDSAEHTLYYNV